MFWSILPLGGKEANRVVEVYPLDLADFELAEKVVKGLVSTEGKLLSDKQGNRLILYDYPVNHEWVRKALGKVQPSVHNIRIKVAFKNNAIAHSNRFSMDGSVRAGPVTVRSQGAPPDGSTRIQLNNTRMSALSFIQQELLVISGGKAKLRIGADVPYFDWLWAYGVRQGYWGGEVRWKEVGAQLVVEPYVVGNNIRIRLTPEFSYIVDGQTLETAIEKLTTELVVANGQEVDLGGLPSANSEFFSKFLVGYDDQGNKRSLQITLLPSIETVQPP